MTKEWTSYLKYLAQWVNDHKSAKFYGASPANFIEWAAAEEDGPQKKVVRLTHDGWWSLSLVEQGIDRYCIEVGKAYYTTGEDGWGKTEYDPMFCFWENSSVFDIIPRWPRLLDDVKRIGISRWLESKFPSLYKKANKVAASKEKQRKRRTK